MIQALKGFRAASRFSAAAADNNEPQQEADGFIEAKLLA